MKAAEETHLDMRLSAHDLARVRDAMRRLYDRVLKKVGTVFLEWKK